jgi:hypothetical protein
MMEAFSTHGEISMAALRWPRRRKSKAPRPPQSEDSLRLHLRARDAASPEGPSPILALKDNALVKEIGENTDL